MKRHLFLTAQNFAPPPSMKSVGGRTCVELALRRLFHQGFIEKHGRAPARGTNPLFEEYRQLLCECDELRFQSPGLARDEENRQSESGTLGRIFARGFLDQHLQYRWFAPISELMKHPQSGWQAERVAKGDMADWLVARDRAAAVAEAKGTHSHVEAGTKKVGRWRAQIANTRVLQGGKPRKLKSWIIATRWVTDDQPRIKPQMYVEDPWTEGKSEPTPEELSTLELWTGRVHTHGNLTRMGLGRLALRVMAGGGRGTRTSVWRCVAPGMESLLFVGALRLPDPALQLLPWVQLYALMDPLIEPFMPRRVWQGLRHYLDAVLRESAFDGLDIRTVKAFTAGRVPELFDAPTGDQDFEEQLTYMPDGSLLCSADLMEPAGYEDL